MSQICPKGAANTRNAQGARAHFTMSQICPNGAANTRNALGARAHFTVSLISNCRWGIGAIAVLPGVSLWINQRLNPFTLGLQPFKKVGQCHRFNVTERQKDGKRTNRGTERQKDGQNNRETGRQIFHFSFWSRGRGASYCTVADPRRTAELS